LRERTKLGDCLKELDEPSRARQTARICCPQGEREGAHQTNQLLAILTTISKKSKTNPS
jgi:hypothetical protein